MEQLQEELVKLIVQTCNVTALPESLPPQSSLFGPESVFGLDSLDAVEVAVAIQQQYGLRITDRTVFQSLETLSAYICDQLENEMVCRRAG